MNKFISVPYIYPICPLSLNHAKMYVLADVLARLFRSQKQNVFFPVASHFTGNTAHSTIKNIQEYFQGNKTDDNIKIITMFRDMYNTPLEILRGFDDPHKLMKYYHAEILWELRELKVSADYENSYITEDTDFIEFVHEFMRRYEMNNAIVINKNAEIALDYDNQDWRDRTIALLDSLNIVASYQKKPVLSGIKTLSSNWELLRDGGYGVHYKDRIIDPMFDSELFMIFDLCHKFGVENYSELFDFLSGKILQNKKYELIGDYLRNSFFIGEEHLKNWLGKKLYAEELLLDDKYRTKNYYIIGMGMLDGKRMSASRGHTILSRDLIRVYGGKLARLIILLGGGQVSKQWNYSKNIETNAQKILNDFNDYMIYLDSENCGEQEILHDEIIELKNIFDKQIIEGYFSQSIIDIFVNLPNKYYNISQNSKKSLRGILKEYSYILLGDDK